jgi:hypothetical protein
MMKWCMVYNGTMVIICGILRSSRSSNYLWDSYADMLSTYMYIGILYLVSSPLHYKEVDDKAVRPAGP